eukprot:s206_g17.t1
MSVSGKVKEMSFADAEYPVKISVEEAWHHVLKKSAGPDLSSGLETDCRLLEDSGETALPMRVKFAEDDQDLALEWAQSSLDEFSTTEGGDHGDLLWDALSAVPPEWSAVTTVMMRNIPNKYTQRMLLMEVQSCGFLGTFDFLYLPIDAETAANRGYAFLNFFDPGSAWMFRCMFEGRKMSRFNSKKVISVVPATLQGFDANYAHYNRARVSRGDPSARPLFLREPTGQRGGLSMKLADTWSSEWWMTEGEGAPLASQCRYHCCDGNATDCVEVKKGKGLHLEKFRVIGQKEIDAKVPAWAFGRSCVKEMNAYLKQAEPPEVEGTKKLELPWRESGGETDSEDEVDETKGKSDLKKKA